MKSTLILILLCITSSLSLYGEITIEQCVQKAIANYPVIKKYSLLTTAGKIELSDINRSWLPSISVFSQVTAQNTVPSFPDALTDMIDKMGQQISGLGKVQYKAGIDVAQTIWDGGTSRVRSEISIAHEKVRLAKLDVEMYQVRQRVENLYFAILLTEQQIAQSRITYNLLNENLGKLRSMLHNGTAMQSDLDMMEAQALSVNQNILQAQSAELGYRKALGILVGEELGNESLAIPHVDMPADYKSNRPELRLFERQGEYNEIAERLANTSLMPRVGLFAQGYYGYPGLNYFQSMMNREMSVNILAGLKISWNIDSFYTRKNTTKRTAINAAEIAVDREIFLFNSHIQSVSQIQTIESIRNLMKDDSRILTLRANVRKAAESQLANGMIDITALLTKISDENNAILTAKYHEILLLQEIYKLKYTLGQ